MVIARHERPARPVLQEAADADDNMGQTSVAKMIREQTGLIRTSKDKTAIRDAVDSIQQVLVDEFLPYRYSPSIPLDALRSELPAALRGNRPLIIAFAPKVVRPRETCAWMIHFVEIAGVGATLDRMVPTITTRADGQWRASGGQIATPIVIPSFGRARYRWSCWNGLWGGGSVVLSFFGVYGPENRFLKVHATAQFPG